MNTKDLTVLVLQKFSAIPDSKLVLTKQNEIWLEDKNGNTFKLTIEEITE